MRAFLFYQDGGTEWVDIGTYPLSRSSLSWFLDCKYVDTQCLEVSKSSTIDLVFDDQFYLTNKKPNVSWEGAVGLIGQPIWGHILMVKHNRNGNLTNLTSKDVQRMTEIYKCEPGLKKVGGVVESLIRLKDQHYSELDQDQIDALNDACNLLSKNLGDFTKYRNDCVIVGSAMKSDSPDSDSH